MEQKVLIWTCIVVFISTSIITLLGLIKKVSIEKTYLNRLFVTLILEVVAIGVLAFKDSFSKPRQMDFVRITMPDPNYSYDRQINSFLSVKGAYAMPRGHSIMGELKQNNETKLLDNKSKNEEVFLYTIHNNDLRGNDDVWVIISVMDKEKIFAKDSVKIKIE
jgi:hypothetical protein